MHAGEVRECKNRSLCVELCILDINTLKLSKMWKNLFKAYVLSVFQECNFNSAILKLIGAWQN